MHKRRNRPRCLLEADSCMPKEPCTVLDGDPNLPHPQEGVLLRGHVPANCNIYLCMSALRSVRLKQL